MSVCEPVLVGMSMCLPQHISGDQRKPVRVSSLFPLCEAQRFNSGLQVSLPSEPFSPTKSSVTLKTTIKG